MHLKLDSYSFQRHGTIDGKVVSISENAFKRDTQQRGGVDAYYLGRIAMDKPSLKNILPGTRLLPGTTLSAEIVVGQRSVMSYLVWPLTKGLNEAIREPK